jgi:GntR family transcriptional regulator
VSSVLAVTPDDPTPQYEQLRRQLVDLIEGGQFVQGERLPPLRQLAGDLGLAVGTVARTYHELEAAGLVRSRVAAGPGWPLGQRPCRRGSGLGAWTSSRSSFTAKVKALGASEEEIHQALSRSLVSLPPPLSGASCPETAERGPTRGEVGEVIVDVIERIEVAQGLSAFLRSGHAETPRMTRRASNHQPRRVLPTRASAARH